METEIKKHLHPKNGIISMDGYLLQPGDTIQKGDVFDSQSGFWEESSVLIGMPVVEGARHTWIRPAKSRIVRLT